MEFEKLKKIIAEQFQVEEDSIRMDTNFVDDLGADSLELFKVVLEVEKEFDIEVSDEALSSIHQVADAVSLIRRTKGQERA